MGEDEVLMAVRELRASGRNATIETIATALGTTSGDIEAPMANLVHETLLLEFTQDVEWLGDKPAIHIAHYVLP